MTYLVMECHPSYAIVLDNEGRMIKAANMGYQEGQVVGEIIARQAPKAPILFRLAPLAAAACLCLAGRETGGYRSQWVSGEYIIKNIQKCGRPFQVLFSSFVLTA